LNGRTELELLEEAKRIMNVKGLTYYEITNHSDLQQLIAQGMYNRITDCNGVNPQSSRSHSVLEFKLTDSNNKIVSKMNFIDLAGSEKGSDVIDMGKQTKFDGAEINKSLLALKECIRALDADKN
jgi:kinesin family protein 2/24